MTMHTALWRTSSLLLPPLSKACVVPRSPTRPPSPFVYTRTQSQCVSMSGFLSRAKSSDEPLLRCLVHPGSVPAGPVAPLGVRQGRRVGSVVFKIFVLF